jgi:hypothetical protein
MFDPADLAMQGVKARNKDDDEIQDYPKFCEDKKCYGVIGTDGRCKVCKAIYRGSS